MPSGYSPTVIVSTTFRLARSTTLTLREAWLVTKRLPPREGYSIGPCADLHGCHGPAGRKVDDRDIAADDVGNERALAPGLDGQPERMLADLDLAHPLECPGIDDADGVALAVGRKHRCAVGGYGDARWCLSDLHMRDNRVRGGIDRNDLVAVPVGDVDDPGDGIDRDSERSLSDLEAPGDLALVGVDGEQLAAFGRRDISKLAVGRESNSRRPAAELDLAGLAHGGKIDHADGISELRRDECFARPVGPGLLRSAQKRAERHRRERNRAA